VTLVDMVRPLMDLQINQVVIGLLVVEVVVDKVTLV
jgi:hypothetical protein